MSLYEYRSGSPDLDLIEASFEPDYLVEHRELSDREIIDFRERFLSFAQQVQECEPISYR